MRVPLRRTPGTNVTPITEGYARGGGAPDFTPITNVIRGFARDIEEQQKSLEGLDLQNKLMQETNDLSKDFEQRRQTQPLGAAGFTDQIATDYEARHTAQLDDLYKQGYSKQALAQHALRLGALRQNFGEQALRFQGESVVQFADAEMGKLKTNLSQIGQTNPAAYPSIKQELEDGYAHFPGLDAPTRDKFVQRDLAEIRQTVGKAQALADPNYVLQKLDPNNLTAPVPAPGASGGAYGILKGWQAVPTTVASKLGLDPVETAAVMSFETGGTFDPNKKGGDGGRYRGLIQFGPEEQAKYGINDNSSPEDWSNAIVQFMQERGFKPGMGIKDFYSTILTGSPGHYDRADSNGTTVENAIPRILAEHKANAEQWLRAAEPADGASGLGGQPASLNPFDPGASAVPQEPGVTAPSIADAKTGDPLFDDMSGQERLQMIGWARERTNQQNAQVKGAMDVAVRNKVEANLRGEDGTPSLTREQVIGALGPVEGEQKWGEVEASQNTGLAIQKMKTLSEAEIEGEVARLRPNPAAATYDIDAKFYDAAKEAQKKILDQRKDDPANYVLSAFPDIAKAYAAADTPDERKAVYGQMIRAYDKLGTPNDQRYLMTDAQVAQLEKTYKTGTPETKMGLIEQMVSEMGPVTAGSTLARAGGDEAAGDLAIYAMMQGRNSRGLFLQVLQGKQTLGEDKARKLSPELSSKSFRAEIKSALTNINGKLSNAFNDAAAALYVYRGGSTDSQTFDAGKYREAFREVVGGQAGNSETGIVDEHKNNAKDWTILPPDINRLQFQNYTDRLTDADYRRLSVRAKPPVDGRGRVITAQQIVDEGVYVFVAPYKYQIKMGSDGNFVKDSSGRNYTMNIRLRPR